ncbi:MAG TPA: hypothetical protein VNG29_04250 [Candidatus Paceibacterota bacterium]|nr:hypothetical protein [Candidatus Paceibacterota bacterium]
MNKKVLWLIEGIVSGFVVFWSGWLFSPDHLFGTEGIFLFGWFSSLLPIGTAGSLIACYALLIFFPFFVYWLGRRAKKKDASFPVPAFFFFLLGFLAAAIALIFAVAWAFSGWQVIR